MKDLSKEDIELFEYYKQKIEFIDINCNIEVVRKFLANIDINKEDIEFYIKTPLFEHQAYKTKSGLYIIKYQPYDVKYVYEDYEEFTKELFLSDKEQENPLYGLIKDSKRYYIEELEYEYYKYKIKNKVKNF